jgi:hypothetical protein
VPEHPSSRLVQEEISQVLVPGNPSGLFPYSVSGWRRDAADNNITDLAFSVTADNVYNLR